MFIFISWVSHFTGWKFPLSKNAKFQYFQLIPNPAGPQNQLSQELNIPQFPIPPAPPVQIWKFSRFIWFLYKSERILTWLHHYHHCTHPSPKQIRPESCQRAAQRFVHLQKGAWGRSLPHTFCPFSDLNWAKPSIGFWFRFGFQQTLQNDASFADILTFHISHA